MRQPNGADDEWLNNEFVTTVGVELSVVSSAVSEECFQIQVRGAAVIKKRGSSSAMSAAKAIGDHLRDWLLGTESVRAAIVASRRVASTRSTQGRCVSMAVPSDGSYDVPSGLVFSFPVTCSNGEWTIVKQVPISEAVDKRMQITKQELLMEQKTAFTMLGIAAAATSSL